MNHLVELKHLTILLADDDEVFCEATKKTLEMLFKQVFCAKNGQEALEIYENNLIHILMLDVRMGDISGIEVAQEIRKKNPKIPIFLASSYTETDELLMACSLHLVTYLSKPFSFEALEKTLCACLEQIKMHSLLRIELQDSVVYDPFQKVIIHHGTPLVLTKSEIIVLELLLEYRGNIVPYDFLYRALETDSSYISLKNIILRLRKKIGEGCIHNLSKMGYQLL